MPTTRRNVSIMTALILSVSALAAHADTPLNGTYNGSYDGFETVAGQSYTVSAPATFDDNIVRGLYDMGDAVTVNGGDFSGEIVGLQAGNGSMLTINAGTFTGDSQYGLADLSGSSATISGGSYTGDADGLLVGAATADLLGGTFSGNSTDLFVNDSSGSLTLFGSGLSFAGMPGITTLSSNSGVFTTMGTITGTLQDDAAPQTFSFQLENGGSITLVNAPAVPEPSAALLLALPLAGLLLRARRRPTA